MLSPARPDSAAHRGTTPPLRSPATGPLRRSWSGRRRCALASAALQLLFEELIRQAGEPEESDLEAEAKQDAALDREIEAAETERGEAKEKERKKGAGWQTRGAERRTHKIAVPEAERTCPQCGRPMKPMGEDVTRRLEYIPGHFVEHEHTLEKYGCGACKEGVVTAPAPPQVQSTSYSGDDAA
jgi:hypothetical protein